ncbi:MAG: hypothetical protein AB1831_03775 [Pseudomonadota bacterium]
MSPLSNNAACLLLPGRAILRQGADLREARQGEAWEGALASLQALLRERRPRGGVRVALSHHFAALHLVAPPPVRLGAEEMEGWLRERLGQDYGAEAAGWRIAWQDVPPGGPVPVASLAAEHHAALAECLGETAPRQISPWGVLAWQRHHRALGRGEAWLALAETGRLALLRVAGGRPTHIGMSRLAEAPSGLAGQLADAVARQALHAGLQAPGEVWLLAPELAADASLPGATLRVRPLGAGGAGWGGLLP